MALLQQFPAEKHRFDLVLTCSNQELWRFNIYLIYELFDERGERVEFGHRLDVIAEDKPYPTMPPKDYPKQRRVEVNMQECHHARVVIHILPFRLPEGDGIANYPPIKMELSLLDNGVEKYKDILPINQWGGKRFDFDLPFTEGRDIRKL